jgi:nucleoid-associated protein YgaU
MEQRSLRAGGVAWVAVLGAVRLGLDVLGRGSLAAPPLSDAAAWAAWAGQTDALIVVFGVLRLALLALWWYLAAVSTLTVAARLSRVRWLALAATALTAPPLRRFLGGTLGVGLVLLITTAGAPPARAGADTAPGVPPAAAGAAEEDEAGLLLPAQDPRALVPGAGDGGPAPGRSTLYPRDAGQVSADAAAPHPSMGDTVVVVVGDHLWGIAEAALASGWGRAPSTKEIAPYWRELIAVNRKRLVDPSNADLILPGQVLVRPAVPGP